VKVICGLGNPGRRYRLTRHNIGFIFLEYLQKELNISFKPGKGEYNYCKAELNDQPVLLIQPLTYMNLSGLAISQVLEYFDKNIDDLLIIYDDFHLSFGELRFRKKGSSGGHNGIESIIYQLQTEVFARLKIGIGNEFEDSVDFVLSKFRRKERSQLELIMKSAYEAIGIWLLKGMDEAMNQFNRNIIDSTETK
jgi:PTH1 family peptidyl-tRNA hydrolase